MTCAATYEAVFAGYEQRREQLRGWVDKHYIHAFGLSPGDLLDAGCGDGFWADLFAARGFAVTGFDVDEAYIAAGRQKYPALRLDVADAEQPLPFGRYDVVFCRTISHLYQPSLEGAAAVVANVLRHVREDGLLLLTAYTDGSGHDRPGACGGRLRHHRVVDYERMLAAAGATVHHWHVVGFYNIWGIR